MVAVVLIVFHVVFDFFAVFAVATVSAVVFNVVFVVVREPVATPVLAAALPWLETGVVDSCVERASDPSTVDFKADVAFEP